MAVPIAVPLQILQTSSNFITRCKQKRRKFTFFAWKQPQKEAKRISKCILKIILRLREEGERVSRLLHAKQENQTTSESLLCIQNFWHLLVEDSVTLLQGKASRLTCRAAVPGKVQGIGKKLGSNTQLLANLLAVLWLDVNEKSIHGSAIFEIITNISHSIYVSKTFLPF